MFHVIHLLPVYRLYCDVIFIWMILFQKNLEIENRFHFFKVNQGYFRGVILSILVVLYNIYTCSPPIAVFSGFGVIVT